MENHDQHLSQARALRAELMAAPDVWLPRRQVIMDWLNAFLMRAERPEYDLGPTEAADLAALSQFLRKQKVPALTP